MNTDAARLDDPQLTHQCASLKKRRQIAQAIKKTLRRGLPPDLENGDSGTLFGRETNDLTEIMVKRNKRPRLIGANREQNLVPGTLQLLVPNGHHIMSGRVEKLQPTTSDILVQF